MLHAVYPRNLSIGRQQQATHERRWDGRRLRKELMELGEAPGK